MIQRHNLIHAVVICAFGLLALGAMAQIVIWDPPHPIPPIPPRPRPEPVRPAPAELRHVEIDAALKGQAARIRLTQTIYNPAATGMEAQFIFPLPEDGALDDFTLIVDGKEMPGRMLKADEARKIYEDIVRRRRDPALMEYIGRGLFKTSVFPVPAKKTVEISLSYKQLCRRDGGAVEFAFPLSAQCAESKKIGQAELTLRIESETPIQTIYSPTHEIETDRKSEKKATVRWEGSNISGPRDFKVFVSSSPDPVGLSLLSCWPKDAEDGFFLLLASPGFKAPEEKAVAKTVVIALDRSGSMQGKKIQQAREALKFVINNLEEGDTFNIVAYDTTVETFEPELQAWSPEMRSSALEYASNIRAGGSTNIDGALQRAMEMIPDDKTRPCYVLFLTDGLPTAGERNEVKIAERCTEANARGARLFSFGVGYDVNSRLLDRLSAGNRGASVYVKPDEDLERAVGEYYGKITAPVLTDLKVAVNGSSFFRTYPEDLPDLFQGGQMVWTGRYNKSGDVKIKLAGRSGDKEQAFKLKAPLADKGEGWRDDFIESLWATRRVAALLDEIDLHGRNQELIDELVDLSKRYGILTPYTSFLADEETPVAAAAAPQLRNRAEMQLMEMDKVRGSSAQAQRSFKAELKSMSIAPQSAKIAAIDMEGRKKDVNTMRTVGTKTFYLRKGVWIDAALGEAALKSAKTVKLYSDEYFDLAAGLSEAGRQYLVFGEAVAVVLDGKAYKLEP